MNIGAWQSVFCRVYRKFPAGQEIQPVVSAYPEISSGILREREYGVVGESVLDGLVLERAAPIAKYSIAVRAYPDGAEPIDVERLSAVR